MLENTSVERALDCLKPHPRQAEMFWDQSDDEIKLLAADMDANGLLQPVEITKDGTIICGHGRVRAAKLLGWETIHCIIRDDLEEEGETAIERRMIDDNLNRRQLDPLQVARCCRRVKELERQVGPGELSCGAKVDLRDRIGKRLGMSGRNLDRYLRVLDTPPAVQRAVSEGRLPLAMAGKVAGMKDELQSKISLRIESGEPPKAVVEGFIIASRRKPALGDAFNRFVKHLECGVAELRGRVSV
ncbi:MAG: ParB/RepB/Spo0J family partition protein [Pirellulaceae bacterium]|nr:ParB/RepB/Spo0J family partition protein [Pirellulaceae bacterium]